MTASASQRSTALDFSDLIAERTRDFTGREWVFQAIDTWLADPEGPTFFIITGEPGIGKTAIAACLTQIRDLAAYHFCRARESNTIDTVVFARSLARQLAEAQIARFSGQKRTLPRQNLGVLRQFLDVSQDRDGNETFRLFHKSLRDYLTNKQRNQHFWCAPEDFHQQKALRLSSHILAVDKNQLAGQLTGRLLTSNNPSVQTLLQQIREQTDRPWLRPVTSSLLPAVSPIMFVLSTHTYPVRAVAVTPDRKRAVSAADDKTLKVWDLQTGAEPRTLTGHTDGVLAVAVGPGGRFAVSGSQDKTVRVWDLETGLQLRCIEAHAAAVSAIAITPDEQYIVSGSYDATLKVWEMDTGTYCRTLQGHAGGINAVALTPG